jgi:von Willebrand factor type A domain/KOW motif
MNDTASPPTTEFVLRRLDEPLRLFGQSLAPWTWYVILGLIVGIGFVYIAWMYLRDSRTIGPWWASFLGLLRSSVYIILAGVFLLPAEQSWYENNQRSKVVLLVDVSLSMAHTRDELPPAGKKYQDMPTRQDKVFSFLTSKDANFIPRLEEKNPITAYRFARGIDTDSRFLNEGRFWNRADREKVLNPKANEELPEGIAHSPEHWANFLAPLDRVKDEKSVHWEFKTKAPEGWKPGKKALEEFKRQAESNQALLEKHFFEGTSVGESLLEVIKQERNNMVQGIVVFTDGRSTDGSLQAIRDAAVNARDAKIPIFVVAVGEDRAKVSIDIVDLRVPPLIRPEDRFPVVVSVNGQDMPNEPFELELDITRVRKDKEGNLTEEEIKLVRLDEKGQIVPNSEFGIGKKVTLKASQYAKEKPVFKPGNPPNAQVYFELDAATLLKATGKTEMGKVGLAPDEISEIRFRARIPKDKREITDIREHLSEPADMRVQTKPLRVLLVASAATREYQFVRAALYREMQNKTMELCIYLQKVPGTEPKTGIVQDIDAKRLLTDFPTKARAARDDREPYYALSSYDVVVTFDADWLNGQISKEQTKLLSDWVFKDGGGLVFVAGALNTEEMARPNKRMEMEHVLNMLPVVVADSRKEDHETDRPRRLVFPQATAEMEYMRLDENDKKAEWKKGWDRFFNEVQDEDGKVVKDAKNEAVPERGFYSYFPSKSVKQNALVVAAFDDPTAKLPGPKEALQPFLATGPWGSGKVVWLASGEMWRLRSFRDPYHERFWTKLLRDVGSNSINTVNRRITPVMSRFGVLNKYQTFEARFVDMNGAPIPRDVKPPPRLHIALPEGAEAHKGDLVLVREGPYLNKKGKVVEVFTEKNDNVEIRKLRLAGIEMDKLVAVEAKGVDVLSPPLDFTPRLGTRPSDELDRKNNGWFQVAFQPRSIGEFKLRVEYTDAADNVYNHKFIVRESNPEIDQTRPDLAALTELASSAKPVLDRLDEGARNRLRNELRRSRPKDKDGKAEVPDNDESLKLLFNLDGARIIPDCMRTQKNDVRTRGKVQDLWDRGFVIEKASSSASESGTTFAGLRIRWAYPGEASVSIFLVVVVGLLSIEWLTRKLLRLA